MKRLCWEPQPYVIGNGRVRITRRCLVPPLLLKDNINTVDMPTSGCTPVQKGHVPPENAPITRVLLDAGAVVLGKANMHELAFGITNNNPTFGPARNPCNPDLIPGGQQRWNRGRCCRRNTACRAWYGHRRVDTHTGRHCAASAVTGPLQAVIRPAAWSRYPPPAIPPGPMAMGGGGFTVAGPGHGRRFLNLLRRSAWQT